MTTKELIQKAYQICEGTIQVRNIKFGYSKDFPDEGDVDLSLTVFYDHNGNSTNFTVHSYSFSGASGLEELLSKLQLELLKFQKVTTNPEIA